MRSKRVGQPMNQQMLKKVQSVQLDILREIKRVCEEGKIDYSLSSGTLLGAIRHQGYIPWDDDVDIDMTRDSYERFIKVAPNLLNKEYYLQTWETNANYANAYSKVMRRDSLYIEKTADECEQGIFVDVFPWDSFPDGIREQIFQGIEIEFLKWMLRAKCKYKMWRGNRFNILKYALYLPFRFMCGFVSKEVLVQRYKDVATRFNGKQVKKMYSHGRFRYGKNTIPVNMLTVIEKHVFEGEAFPIPNGYDEYLTVFYSNYMTLPPKEERYGHCIVEIRLPQGYDQSNE